MKDYLQQLRQKFAIFMQGRYGSDEIYPVGLIAGLILMILAKALGGVWSIGSPLALLLFGWILFRFFSRNIYKRREERNRYLAMIYRVQQKQLLVKNIWKNRKTHRYYSCPYCKTMVRVPKLAKGKTIAITCPQCHQTFEKKF